MAKVKVDRSLYEGLIDEKTYDDFIEDYDRTAYGAGSQKDPAVDRFSGFDVKQMYKGGLAAGLDKRESYEKVQDYFDSVKDETKHGGRTAKKLARYRAKAYKDANPEPTPEPTPEEGGDVVSQPDQSIAPVVSAPVTGGGLSPSMYVNQSNPVKIDGKGNQVDNSINQITTDMSDNRMYYAGTNFNMPTNPMLVAAGNLGNDVAVNVDTDVASPNYAGGSGNTITNVNTNTLTGGNVELNFLNDFMRSRLFDM